MAKPFASSPTSRTAGRFVAANYGQWSLNVFSFPAGTGTKQFAVTSPLATLTDGRQIIPFNTNAPIYVGTEKVTPTAVVQSSANPGGYLITASFSNAHGAGETVSSATFGLQESLNDANASGGGVVVIDSAWAALGGTTTIKNAATVPSGTGIEDLRTGPVSPGTGTVTSVSVTTANGVSGTVATATTTPAISLTLGAINPTSIGATTPAAITGTTITATTSLVVKGTGGDTGVSATLSDIGSQTFELVAPNLQLLSSGATANLIMDSGSGGTVYIGAQQQGNVQIGKSATSSITLKGLIKPGVIFSAAGTALPSASSAGAGTLAVVSDATAPIYNATYTSGGAVVALVISDGTNWKTI